MDDNKGRYPSVKVANNAVENVLRDWFDREDRLNTEVALNVKRVLMKALATAVHHRNREGMDFIMEITHQFRLLYKRLLYKPESVDLEYERLGLVSCVGLLAHRGQLN